MKNGIIGGAVFLTIAGVIGWQVYERIQQEQSSGQGQWGSGGGRRNAPVAVEVVEVKLQDITDKIFLTGTLEPESRFIVAPKVSGRLESLLVEMGDFVKKGQQLAKLDDAEAVQQTRMAEAALKTAKSSLEVSKETADQAEREFRRQKDLFGKGLTSQLQLENAKSQYLSRQANLRMAQSILSERRFSLETSRIRLSYTEIRIKGGRYPNPGCRRTICRSRKSAQCQHSNSFHPQHLNTNSYSLGDGNGLFQASSRSGGISERGCTP